MGCGEVLLISLRKMSIRTRDGRRAKKKKHEMENRNRETGARASAELGVDGCRMGYGDGV